MALSAGTLSIISVQSTTDSLAATAASGGTGPYTQQWYKSTAGTSFAPGPGNIIAGATALTLNDSGLIPGTSYFYKVVYTDTGAAGATVTSAPLPVSTSAQGFVSNQLAQSVGLGMPDQRLNYNTEPVMIDGSQTTPIFVGCAVKIMPGTGSGPNSAPSVVACTSNSDNVFGFIAYNAKDPSYIGNYRSGFIGSNTAEIFCEGNVMYLYATGPITRGSRVTLDVTTQGGVAAYVAGSGASIVGWAYDGADVGGKLFRVKLLCPSFAVA